MRYLEIDGARLSRIGLGTWQFGSREWAYGDAYATETAPTLVRRAAELGVTMLDTAEVYAFGRSESIVGATVAALPTDVRSTLTVATKFMPVAPAEPVVAWQAAGSLRRLGVDALDLWYAHWPNPLVSPARTMQSVRPLVEAGLVRRVGVSNHSLAQWRDAERGLRGTVVANQVRFNLLATGPAADLVPYAARTGRVVVAYSPLAQGLLAAPDPNAEVRRPGGLRAADPRHGARGRARVARLVAAIRDVAAGLDATPAQVALAWVLHHENTIVIPGARTVEQLEENVAAAEIGLDQSAYERLSAEARAL